MNLITELGGQAHLGSGSAPPLAVPLYKKSNYELHSESKFMHFYCMNCIVKVNSCTFIVYYYLLNINLISGPLCEESPLKQRLTGLIWQTYSVSSGLFSV